MRQQGAGRAPGPPARRPACGCWQTSHPAPPAPRPIAGVAYVKFDRASSAALAIENLHEVTLNDGQGPRLKVLLADSPHTRWEGRRGGGRGLGPGEAAAPPRKPPVQRPRAGTTARRSA